jgi:hypothetical protein
MNKQIVENEKESNQYFIDSNGRVYFLISFKEELIYYIKRNFTIMI